MGEQKGLTHGQLDTQSTQTHTRVFAAQINKTAEPWKAFCDWREQTCCYGLKIVFCKVIHSKILVQIFTELAGLLKEDFDYVYTKA